jgi:hypothetical protein
MEPAAKGSFQAAKLQRSARTTVCSHSTRDVAAMRSIKSQHDDSDTQDDFLSGCGQCKQQFLGCCFVERSLFNNEEFFALYR